MTNGGARWRHKMADDVDTEGARACAAWRTYNTPQHVARRLYGVRARKDSTGRPGRCLATTAWTSVARTYVRAQGTVRTQRLTRARAYGVADAQHAAACSTSPRRRSSARKSGQQKSRTLSYDNGLDFGRKLTNASARAGTDVRAQKLNRTKSRAWGGKRLGSINACVDAAESRRNGLALTWVSSAGQPGKTYPAPTCVEQPEVQEPARQCRSKSRVCCIHVSKTVSQTNSALPPPPISRCVSTTYCLPTITR